LHRSLTAFDKSVKDRRLLTLIKRSTALEIIKKAKYHYAGLRTIARILYEIKRCAMWLEKLESSLKEGRYSVVERIINEHKNDLPLGARQHFQNVDDEGGNLEDMEKVIEEKYGDMHELFDGAIMENTRTLPCDVCNRLFRPDQVRFIKISIYKNSGEKSRFGSRFSRKCRQDKIAKSSW
jgi:hypothetical protein